MRYFEDIVAGETVETPGYMMTESEIMEFAGQFDPQYFHTDAERARHSIFGGLVASGWHTAAAMMRLQVAHIIDQWTSLGSPGFDNLRWLKPVRPGDTIRARLTCTEKSPSKSRPDIGSCKFATEVINQHDEVVMTLVQIGIMRRRPTDAAKKETQS